MPSTDADIVHWHGLAIDSLNDGAMEEGSPMIPAGATHRATLYAEAVGHALVSHPCRRRTAIFRWGLTAGSSVFCWSRAQPDPAHYDQEIYLAIHHWEPSFVPMVETMRAAVGKPSADDWVRCGIQVRDHERAHAGRGRADSREAGAAGADAPAECERDGERGAGAARASHSR